MQLCLGISANIFNKINTESNCIEDEHLNISCENINKKIRPFLKKTGLTLNRNSITSFIAYYMKFIRKMKFYFGKVTLNHCFFSQLSLF